MASAKKDGAKAASGEVVLVPFAYATAKDGEVVQLRKGDTVDAGKFTKESLDHLRSIDFIGTDDSDK